MAPQPSQQIDSNEKVDYVYSDHVALRNGHMYVENVRLTDLRQQLEETLSSPSPAFVYSRAQIVANVLAYKEALNNAGIDHLLGYSVKANYNPEVVKLMYELGCTATTVSGQEIQLAKSVGIEPSRIIFNGTGKTSQELDMAVHDECLINLDSVFDLDRIIHITNKLNRPASVVLRLNPNIDSQVHPFLATGLSMSKFGIDDEQFDVILDRILTEPLVKLVGLHCHLGSTIDNTAVFSECLDIMLNLIDEIKKKGFTFIKYLNLGGGLGINYWKHKDRTERESDNQTRESEEEREHFMDLIRSSQSCDPQLVKEVEHFLKNDKSGTAEADSIFKRLHGFSIARKTFKELLNKRGIRISMPSPSDLINVVKDRIKPTGLTLILEPGRSLIGNAAMLYCTVQGWKKNGSQNYVVVDGSMNEVIRPSLYGAYHHIELTEPVKNTDDSAKKVFDVVGPVCECADFLGKGRYLSIPHSGCGLAVFDVGAYCGSMASNYNMRMRPAEVLVDGDSWRIIRRPDTMDDLLKPFTDASMSEISPRPTTTETTAST